MNHTTTSIEARGKVSNRRIAVICISIIVQFFVSCGTWFNLFGILFSNGYTLQLLLLPLGIASVGSMFTSSLVLVAGVHNIILANTAYTLPWLLWFLIVLTSDAYGTGMFWLIITAIIFASGVFGAYTLKILTRISRR